MINFHQLEALQMKMYYIIWTLIMVLVHILSMAASQLSTFAEPKISTSAGDASAQRVGILWDWD